MFDIINKILKQPRHKKLYSRIPDDHIAGSESARSFDKPVGNYFQIRLCELYLRDKREYWFEYNPMGIVVSEFLYDGKRECVPYFVGNQILGELEDYLDGQYVDFRNTRVAGPIPYMGDDVGLFVGLFRIKVNDLMENLFGILENIAKSFDATMLSRYLEISKPLSQGFSDFFKLKKNDLRFGVRDVFNDLTNDPQQMRQGYLVYSNCPENVISLDNLWVNNNQLYYGKTKEKTEPFKDYDYCLVKIEFLPTRNDYIKLPFYDLWKTTRLLLMNDEKEKAKWKRIEMLQSLANCPDLTEEHREKLIGIFELNYLNLLEAKSDKKTRSAEPTRGGGKSDNVKYSIQKAASLAKKAGYKDSVVKTIKSFSDNWETILNVEAEDNLPTDNTINTQLMALEEIKKRDLPDPKGMADALTQAVLNGNK